MVCCFRPSATTVYGSPPWFTVELHTIYQSVGSFPGLTSVADIMAKIFSIWLMGWLKLRNVAAGIAEWFNKYLGYLQYVSWCTNVRFMFVGPG